MADSLVKVGTYSGDGNDNRSITGVGFQPDWVFICTSDSGIPGAETWDAMGADESYRIRDYNPGGTNWTVQTNMVQSLDADGFEIGSADEVNKNGSTYYYLAVKKNDTIVTGSYTGDGNDNRNITGLGITPNYVYLQSTEQWGRPILMTSDHANNTNTRIFGGTGSNDSLQQIGSSGVDSFQVGTNEDANQISDTYYYLTIANTSGVVKAGSYTGNGSDDRGITGIGFQPDWVFIMIHDSGQTEGNRILNVKTSNISGDSSIDGTQQQAAGANRIQSLDADGFTIGTDDFVNKNTSTYYYLALKNTSAAVNTRGSLLTTLGVG